MTSEFLLDAIGLLDDDLILEAAAPAKRSLPWIKVAGLAAAVAVCIGIARVPFMNTGSTAAPEAENAMGSLTDRFDGFDYAADQESVVLEPSATNREDYKGDSQPVQGVFEPRFVTLRGVYLPTAFPTQPNLPDANANKLGVLVATVPGEQRYPSTGTQELVGCPVWESEDGEYLYIQLPDGVWLTARLVK